MSASYFSYDPKKDVVKDDIYEFVKKMFEHQDIGDWFEYKDEKFELRINLCDEPYVQEVNFIEYYPVKNAVLQDEIPKILEYFSKEPDKVKHYDTDEHPRMNCIKARSTYSKYRAYIYSDNSFCEGVTFERGNYKPNRDIFIEFVKGPVARNKPGEINAFVNDLCLFDPDDEEGQINYVSFLMHIILDSVKKEAMDKMFACIK